MILTYKYRLMPSKAQHAALAKILEGQRQLYNAALEEWIGCYKTTGKGRSYFAQCGALTQWRRDDQEAAGLPLNIQRWTLKRLDDAYQAFYRRLKERAGKAGFPRFKGRHRWNSFGFNEMDGLRWDGKRLRFRSFPGGLLVHLHRSLPTPLDVRSCIFRRDHKGWIVCFQIAVENTPRRLIERAIGLDLGLSVFAYRSDGIAIPNPKIARKAHTKLRRHQRALVRCRRGSKRRNKIRDAHARAHKKILNARMTWLHQQSSALVTAADLIAAEDLNISGLIKNSMLARSIADAAWSRFISMVSYKAERAGATFIAINPKNTSQRCSGCGELVPKSLAVRTHSCPSCGLVIDRDWNAARNILQAVVGLGEPNVAQWGERALKNLGDFGQDTTTSAPPATEEK